MEDHQRDDTVLDEKRKLAYRLGNEKRHAVKEEKKALASKPIAPVLDEKRKLAYRLGNEKRHAVNQDRKTLPSQPMAPVAATDSEDLEDPFEDIEAFLVQVRQEMDGTGCNEKDDDSSLTDILLRQRTHEENQKMGKGKERFAEYDEGKKIPARSEGIDKFRVSSDHLESDAKPLAKTESVGKKKKKIISAGAYRMGGNQAEEEQDSMLFQMPTLTAVKVEEDDPSMREERTQKLREEIIQTSVQAMAVEVIKNSEGKSRRTCYLVIVLVFLLVVVSVGVALALVFTTKRKNMEDRNLPRMKPYGNTWVKLGDKLIGSFGGQEFGESVDVNADATMIAIGSNNIFQSTGRAEVMGYTATHGWYQIGNRIDGHFKGENFGHTVQLSADGKILVVGGFGSDKFGLEAEFYGYVYGYKFDYELTQWLQIGQGIQGSHKGDRFGIALSMANDGKSWIVGADNHFNNGKRDGYSKVYALKSGSWEQKGSAIRGENGSRNGYSVAMSGDGQTVCVGERDYRGLNQENEMSRLGRVRCFEWLDDDWAPKGNAMVGYQDNAYDPRFGYSVALNDNGSIVTASARWGGPKAEGVVAVYEFKNNEWLMQGDQMFGDREGDSIGFKVAMNGRGNVVAFTGRGYDLIGKNNTGVVKVMRYIDDAWQPLGNILAGYENNDYFGESVTLNHAGTAVAAAANWGKVEYVTAFALVGEQELLMP